MSALSPLTSIPFFTELFNPNNAVIIPKPKSSRWNRNYTKLAEYHQEFHYMCYPKRFNHLYLQDTATKIDIPRLIYTPDVHNESQLNRLHLQCLEMTNS